MSLRAKSDLQASCEEGELVIHVQEICRLANKPSRAWNEPQWAYLHYGNIPPSQEAVSAYHCKVRELIQYLWYTWPISITVVIIHSFS